MNEKKAKQLRQQARAACEASGIPLDTTYKAVNVPVRFDGRVFPWSNPTVSTQRAERLDAAHDIAKARKYGILPNLLLQDLYGSPVLTAVRVELGECLRGVVQRTKRALR